MDKPSSAFTNFAASLIISHTPSRKPSHCEFNGGMPEGPDGRTQRVRQKEEMMRLQQLLSYTRKAIDEYQMIDEGDRIAVGISGGKDSLTLLYVASWASDASIRSILSWRQ